MPSVAFKIACMPPSNKYIYMTDSVRDEHSKNGMLVYFSVTVQLKGKKIMFLAMWPSGTNTLLVSA
jgi:hypothetical protein